MLQQGLCPSVSSNLGQLTLSDALVTPSTLPATWSSLGCYTYVPVETPLTCTLQATDVSPLFSSDNVGNVRTLGSASYTDNAAMTDESCITYCTNQGYIYAGTEYSSECCKPSTFGGVKPAPRLVMVS